MIFSKERLLTSPLEGGEGVLKKDISHLTKLLKSLAELREKLFYLFFHAKVISKSESVPCSNAFLVNTEAYLSCLTFWMVDFPKSYFQTCVCFETPSSVFYCINLGYALRYSSCSVNRRALHLTTRLTPEMRSWRSCPP